MAFQNLAGFTGLMVGKTSQFDGRVIGKLTDANHLESFHQEAPNDYDKKIISIYSQKSLYSNDFLDMINKSKPFYVGGLSDAWQWDIEKPFKFSQIVDVPTSTMDLDYPGVDGKEFEIVVDNQHAKNTIVCIGHKIFGPQFFITADPTPYSSRGWLHRCTLMTTSPTDYVDKKYLRQGMEVIKLDTLIGEFDQDLGGLDKLADRIKMFETLGAAYGVEHTITGWADDKMLRDTQGRALDIQMYMNVRNGKIENWNRDVKWEPFIEFQMRKEMLQQKVDRMIWSKPGFGRTNGGKQELKYKSAGVYHRMRTSGNYVPYNRGEFGPNLIRTVFGDLFYRREDMKDRKVELFTNEAGFDVFQNAVKEDAMNSGLVFNVGDNEKFVSGSGQNLEMNYAFSSFVTRETGRVNLRHLKELDLPQTSLEFGQNKKSTPIFLVFNVSPTSGGDGLTDNIREVRREGRPNMLWSYIDGRRSHLGALRSQGHQASSKFDGYTITMEDRADAFIEDMSRTVLIEENPQI